VCLNHTQVRELELPPAMEAKDTSKNFEKFVEKYGSTDTYELEAVPPEQMQQILRDAIEEVMDRAAFDAEMKQEEKDAAELDVIRKRMLAAIGPLANRN
jgi:hypothetical protein